MKPKVVNSLYWDVLRRSHRGSQQHGDAISLNANVLGIIRKRFVIIWAVGNSKAMSRSHPQPSTL
ncbi:MAG: hypothetical protein ACXW02_05130 [Halobacteriota archaeon]